MKSAKWDRIVLGCAIGFATGCTTAKVRQVQVPDAPEAKRSIASDEIEDVVASMKAWVKTPSPNIEGGFYTKLEDIGKAKLKHARTTIQPWSGSYWPDRIGGVAVHYRKIDQRISMTKKPTRVYNKFLRLHNRMMANELTEDQIALAAATEKYDLWMGDEEFTLTNKVWEGILQQYNAQGGLKSWSGLCNGWTSSSIEFNRPRRVVRVKAPDGKTIPFYPDDMKALATLLYGHNFVDAVNYGARCSVKKPARHRGVVLDIENYVRAANECSDLNPGVWHLAIVNRLGVQGKGFVMDKDYDEVVNNHVVTGYDYAYFNPKTGKFGGYKEARLPIDEYRKDPFGNVRHPDTAWVVGVKMDVAYLHYVFPKGKAYDDESLDKVKNYEIKYDLEIAEDGTVIGGNWRINKKQKISLGIKKPRYPDFIWYFDKPVVSTAEYVGETLNIDIQKEPLPVEIREKAKVAANTRWKFFTLGEQAGAPTTPQEYKDKAEELEEEQEKLQKKVADGDSEAQEKLAKVETKIANFRKEMNDEGYLDSHPYVQPVASVVRALFEAAKEADPDAPKEGPVDLEEEDSET